MAKSNVASRDTLAKTARITRALSRAAIATILLATPAWAMSGDHAQKTSAIESREEHDGDIDVNVNASYEDDSDMDINVNVSCDERIAARFGTDRNLAEILSAASWKKIKSKADLEDLYADLEEKDGVELNALSAAFKERDKAALKDLMEMIGGGLIPGESSLGKAETGEKMRRIMTVFAQELSDGKEGYRTFKAYLNKTCDDNSNIKAFALLLAANHPELTFSIPGSARDILLLEKPVFWQKKYFDFLKKFILNSKEIHSTEIFEKHARIPPPIKSREFFEKAPMGVVAFYSGLVERFGLD